MENQDQPPKNTQDATPVKENQLFHAFFEKYPLIKWLILAIILILLLFYGIAYFYLNSNEERVSISPISKTKLQSSPTPVETFLETADSVYTEGTQSANWKVYVDEKYGYALKYPKDWTIDTTNPQSTYIKIHEPAIKGTYPNTNRPIFSEQADPEKYAVVSIVDTDGVEKTVEQVALEYRSGKQGSITIGGKHAIKVMSQPPSGDGEYLVPGAYTLSIFVKNNSNRTLLLQLETANLAQYEPIFNQILSTFKFIDDKTIISTDTFSPDAYYSVHSEQKADYNTIAVQNRFGTIVIKDLVKENEEAMGYNTKFQCQCNTTFKGWVSNEKFAIKIVNGGGEEYEYIVDVSSKKVDETTFRKIK